MFITNELKDASAVFVRHKNAVQNALHEYRESVSEYGSRYAPEFAKQKIAEAKNEAGNKIARADKEMHDSITSIVDTVRYNARNAITAAPSARFSSVMKEYKRYGLKMTEFEIRAFAEQAAGSYVEMRILQSVAADSGFRVSVPSVAEFEEDIKRIERGARIPSMYTPAEYTKEASEVLGERPHFRDDGSVYQRSGKADALYLMRMSDARDRLVKDLDTVISEKWSQKIVPKVEQDADNASAYDRAKEPGESEEKTTAEQEAKRKEFAEDLTVTQEDDYRTAEIAAQNEAAEGRSREVMAHYLRR